MKINIFIIFLLTSFFFLQSCSKDEPTPEIDQEEVSGATLHFTQVEAELHGDHFHYHDIEGAETASISFSGENFLPPVGAHLDLELGETYRFELKVKDFAGRESQQSFIEREEQHFAFLLGIPEGSFTAEYADKKTDGTSAKVGITGYITVNKLAGKFNFRYVMRHLNPGVKANIDTKMDIFNKDFLKFSGATDLDLKFEMHIVESDHAHD